MTYYSQIEIVARKEFPLLRDEVLKIRDGFGRVVEQWTIGGKRPFGDAKVIHTVHVQTFVPT